MSLRKVLALLVLSSMLLTTQLYPMVPAAPVQSRAPASNSKLPAFNYTWDTHEKAWNWWNYASFPGDKDHMFFVFENKVMFLDYLTNTTSEIANITYKKDTDPNGPDYNSTLYDIRVTKLSDGRYHVGILENQEENNQTTRYLLVMIVAQNGTLVAWDRPMGNASILGMDIERNLCFVIIKENGITYSYMVWWDRFDNNIWVATTFGGGGQGSPPDGKWVITISYNQSDSWYIVLYLPSGSSWIDVLWVRINGGGQGIGGPYATVDGTWGIVAMDSAYDSDNGISNLTVAVMEQNENDGSHRVEFIRQIPPWSMHEPIWVGQIYEPGGAIMRPYFNQNTNIAISSGDGVSCIMYPSLADGMGGGGTLPTYITSLFLSKDGTVLGNATFKRLADGAIGTFMDGHSFYVGGRRETSGGATPPHNLLFMDKVTPHFFGDWGLEGLHAAILKDMYSVNETLTFIAQPGVDGSPLRLSWIEQCNVNLSVDGTRISPIQWPLYPSHQMPPVHIDWKATLGLHNITASLEVLADPNWTNNTISITVKVGLPDLRVTNLTVEPTIIEPGTAVLVKFNLSNLGADLLSATVELDLGSMKVWTKQLQDLAFGYEQGFNQTLATGNFPFGTFDLTLKALPQNSSDSNWSNNQVSTKLRIYDPKIEIFVDNPKSQDQVAKTLLIQGHVKDPENETVSVWADLKAGFFSNTTLTVTTKYGFELPMDISKVVVGRYTLTVHVNGTLGRSAQSVLDIFVRNGPYWTFLDPAGNTTAMKENTTMNFTARATDWGTNKTVKVNWTLDGKDAAGLADVSINNGILSYSPGYDGAGLHTIKADAFNLFGRVSHTWTVNVTNVNRPPQISNVTPSGTIKIVLGGHQNFTSTAADPDGDSLNYTWMVGNRTFYGSAISFKPEAPGNFTMFLYVSDGKVSAVYQWKIVVVTKGPPPIIPPPPVKHHTTVQSPWVPWLILVVVLGTVAGLVGYYFMKERPAKKGPVKGLKGANK
jgi:hypothetical protein